ncbi:hypothetical protein [Saccharopolyspora flava]|uniref:Uncharacterized protein n=1 Tax=Saccharopolyspora flava TaxID=95161 RepID=A0A1I6TNW6_9PSEU|nr:hypothetical protein [Saccharopolyspora flava]SFS90929.1 hypothetical protein SAMN05660874_04155 [Saccharopolyspora flava]
MRRYTLGALDPGAAPQWDGGVPEPVDCAQADCVPVTGELGPPILDRVDESCFIWDSRDRLVAHSTQLAGIRLDLPG